MRRFYVYILRCSDGSLYTGYTIDLKRRLSQHRSGHGSSYVASRLPATLAYFEEVASQSRALRREHEVKKLTREEKLRLCRSQNGMMRRSLR